MKIIYYSPHPTHDIVSEVGYATHQREVINALVRMGHTVIPVIMGGTEKGKLSVAGTPVAKNSFKAIIKHFIPGFVWTSIKDYQLLQHDKIAARELERAILNHQPDLIYERSEYLQDRSLEVIKKYKIKYFLEINAPFIEEMKGFEGYSIWHSLAHRKERHKNDAAEKIFVVSTALKQFIEERYGVQSEKIIIQPNCINLERVHFDHLKAERLKVDLGMPGKKVLGFVGSIFPHHGVDILIDAFELVVQKKPETILLIVGDGSTLNELKERVVKNLSEKVVFAGKRSHDEVFNYITLMDICVMAKSNWYMSPIKIFEYAIMGKPIVAPNTSAVKDVMENGKEGLLVEMNKEEVSMAILKLMDNPLLSEIIAGNFKKLVMDNYTWDKAAEKIVLAASPVIHKT